MTGDPGSRCSREHRRRHRSMVQHTTVERPQSGSPGQGQSNTPFPLEPHNLIGTGRSGVLESAHAAPGG